MKLVIAVLAAVILLAIFSLLGVHLYDQPISPVSTLPPALTHSPSPLTSPIATPEVSPNPTDSPAPSSSPLPSNSPVPSSSPRVVLVAPQLISPGNDTTQNSRMMNLQWTPVTSADHYQVEIQFCNHSNPCDDSNTSTLGTFSSSSSTLVVTQLKNYLNVNVRWRVVALNAQGSSPSSDWGRFHAVMGN